MAMRSRNGLPILAAYVLFASGCENSDLAASARNLSSAGSSNVDALGGAGGAGSDAGGDAGAGSDAGAGGDVGGAGSDVGGAGSDAGGAGRDAGGAGSDAASAGSAGALPEVESAGAAGGAEPPAVCMAASAQGAPPLIDDFEDGDNVLLQPSNRHGYWYANNDGSGIQVPEADPSGASFTLDAPGSPSSSKHALHTTGSGFALWGAFVSTSLNVQANGLCPYDATSFSGIRFNAKGSGALRVEVGTLVTTPVSGGGQCASLSCSDYGLDVNLSSDWARVSIPFDAVQLPVWASPAQWAPDAVVRLSFWVEHGGFDFWIDDVTFY